MANFLFFLLGKQTAEGLCCYTSSGSRNTVKKIKINVCIFNKRAQATLKNAISLYGCGEMKWSEVTANSFQLLAFLQL